MKFLLIPGNGWTPPTDQQMARFFALVAAHPRDTIFIHCWLGEDRTGVFIAAYRIAFEHWTAEESLEEMHQFHFKSFWHPAMKGYIREFPGRLATSPVSPPIAVSTNPHSPFFRPSLRSCLFSPLWHSHS